VERLGVKIELMVDPIMMQLAQGIVRPSLNVVVGIFELFCGKIQFFENFTLCHLNNFDVILFLFFWDVYETNIFCNGSKLKVRAKSGSKLMNLNAYSNFASAKMGVNFGCFN
jgi:hypothetical protein